MSDLPIAWIFFCGFCAFGLFALGYLVGLGASQTIRDIGRDDDDR